MLNKEPRLDSTTLKCMYLTEWRGSPTPVMAFCTVNAAIGAGPRAPMARPVFESGGVYAT